MNTATLPKGYLSNNKYRNQKQQWKHMVRKYSVSRYMVLIAFVNNNNTQTY